jgi:hypothetical protein
LVVLVSLGILQESLKTEPISWYPSYADFDDRPLGSEVFYNLMQTTDVVRQQKTINQNPYQFFEANENKKGDIIFFNSYVNLTEAEVESTLDWVDKGNNVLIASKGFPEQLRDTLGFNNLIEYSYDRFNLEDAKYELSWYHKDKSKDKKFGFWKDLDYMYFDSISPQVEVVSRIERLIDSTDKKHIFPNAIKADFGKGSFYLISTPAIFSNYFLMEQDNYQYTFKLLEYLDLSSTYYIDQYYKNVKNTISSPLYYLLTNDRLKTGYYLLIITLLFFIIFEGKRKQKPIRVIEPLANKSLEFATTIAGLYYKNKDHKSIATKRIQLLKQFIRAEYKMNPETINDEFIEELAQKSNTKVAQVKHLFKLIRNIDQNKEISKEQLEDLDRSIKILKQ